MYVAVLQDCSKAMEKDRTSWGTGVIFLLVGVTLGLLISVTWRPQVDASMSQELLPGDAVWEGIRRLEAEQGELKADLADLRRQLAARQQEVSAHTDRLRALNAELARQQLMAGLVPLEGPGVVVTLDDSQISVPARADPNAYIIHEYDLRDIVNLLWMAGAEAISINDERLVGNSSIYCVGSTVLVNDTRLSPPYVIRAVGHSRVLSDTLRNPSYLQELKEKQHLYGIRFDVDAMANLTLPAYSGSFSIHYARPGE